MHISKIIIYIIELFVSVFISQSLGYYYYDAIVSRYVQNSFFTCLILRIVIIILLFIFMQYLFNNKELSKNKIIAIFTLYIIIVLALTLKPVNMRMYNFNILQVIETLPMAGQKLLLIANIVFYIPIGYGLHYFFSSKKVLLVMLIIVVLLEGFQYISMLGMFDIDDILLNYLGFIIGYLIYKLIPLKIIG